MKSPIYDNYHPHNLSYSTINETKHTRYSYEQPSNLLNNSSYRSYRNTNKQIIQSSMQANKKQNTLLRNTICVSENVEDNKNKKYVDKTLRKTSYLSDNQYKYTKNEQIKTQYIDTKQVLSPTYVAKIMKDEKQYVYAQKQQYSKTQKKLQQIQKTTKQINQLLKISKQSNKQYTVQPNQKYLTKKYQQAPLVKSSLKDSKYNDIQSYKPELSNSAQFLYQTAYLKQKLQLKKKQQPDIDQKGKYKNKNPEQSLLGNDGFRKIKNSYYTPKQVKTQAQILVQSKYTPKLNIHKKYSINYQLSTYNDNQIHIKNNSWNLNSSYTSYKNTQHEPIKNKQTFEEKDSFTSPRGRQPRKIKDQKILKLNKDYFNQKTLICDFNLSALLGQGKFGKVYRAIHKNTNFIFAIKKINKKMIQQNLMKEQLIQQIKIQYYCNHPNILKLYGFFDDSQHIYLILQYMEEGTLFSQLKKNKILTQKETAIKVQQVASAMTYLHDHGIIHRDIKPENIVITNGHAKLCDFGWAAICKDRRKTYCGTFDYAAPEILEGTEYDMSVDLWCLGILAYQLLVGKAPFYHFSRKQTIKKIMNVQKTAIQYPSHLSKNAISFIQSLLRKNPMQRMAGQNILNHIFLPSVLDNHI